CSSDVGSYYLVKINDTGGPQSAQATTEGHHGLLPLQVDREDLAAHPRPTSRSFSRARSGAIRSVALRPRCPRSRAASSAAREWTQTPRVAACHGPRPWASKPPRTPLSTSPMPPLA